jgi:hypothetical protein
VELPGENPLLVTDPTTLVALEGLGLSLGRQLGAPGETGDALVRSPRYATLVATIEADVRELSGRDGIARRQFPTDRKKLNYAFNVDWLRDASTHFELIGFSNRLDMMYFTPGDCGQVRLVYRLALQRRGRPMSRLPLFVTLIRRQHLSDVGDCSGSARAWAALDLRGPGRAQALVNFVAGQPDIDRVELNFQNLHGTGTPEVEEHAEYVLRSFDVFANRLSPRPLLNTPRLDLSTVERDELLHWVIDHFVEIDRGSAILPDRFSATRSVSVSPRGLARPGNRPFQTLLGGAPTAGALAAMPYENGSVVRSPAGLLRRLDELTCPGCHQSRAIAGFHLLGEERVEGRTFDALAVGASPHVHGEHRWRKRLARALASGSTFAEPRPFAEHADGDGRLGTHCGLGDPSFRTWTCQSGLRCRDSNHDDVGQCAPPVPGDGDACQDSRVVAAAGANGDRVARDPEEPCQGIGNDARCASSSFGFPLGMCYEACTPSGAVVRGHVCMPMLRSKYEEACFESKQPFLDCVNEHKFLANEATRACDAANPCRDDYACARVAGATNAVGGCVPPYFLFQNRVDGPFLDR